MLSISFKSHLIRHLGTGHAFKDTQRTLKHLRHSDLGTGHSKGTQRALGGHLVTWALGGHLDTRRALGHSEGTRALGRHSDTSDTWALGHLGHSGTLALRALRHLGTWALKALAYLGTRGTLFSRLIFFAR